VRNALILLVVVALVILAVGALNNGTAFDVDYVAGTISAVSLFWVSAVIAALVFVVGIAAAWFAQSAVAGTRRKLEAELQSTYERLREAEALAARPAPAVEATAVAEPSAIEAAEEATVVAGEGEAVVAAGEATEAETEDATIVSDQAITAIADEPGTVAMSAGETAEPGEATAVTMTGAAPEAEETGPAGAAANGRPDGDESDPSVP
jgi:uncharacterized membrane protein YciS (DUF1049 family)